MQQLSETYELMSKGMETNLVSIQEYIKNLQENSIEVEQPQLTRLGEVVHSLNV